MIHSVIRGNVLSGFVLFVLSYFRFLDLCPLTKQEVLKWLHANRTEGCTQAAVDWAAGNGHIETLRWLLQKRRPVVGYSDRALDWATKNGHSEVVSLLEEVRHSP